MPVLAIILILAGSEVITARSTHEQGNPWIDRLSSYYGSLDSIEYQGHRRALTVVGFLPDEWLANGVPKDIGLEGLAAQAKVDGHRLLGSLRGEFRTLVDGGSRRSDYTFWDYSPLEDQELGPISLGMLRHGSGWYRWTAKQHTGPATVGVISYVPPLWRPDLADKAAQEALAIDRSVLTGRDRIPSAVQGKEFEIVQQANHAGRLEALTDGCMLGFLDEATPLRLDVILRLADSVTVQRVPTATLKLGFEGGGDEAVVLSASSVLGEITVVLLPELDCMPARLTLHKSGTDIAGPQLLGQLRLGDSIPTVAHEPEWTLATATVVHYEVTAFARFEGTCVPITATVFTTTSFEGGFGSAHGKGIERTSIRRIEAEDKIVLKPQFQDGMRVARAAGGPGLPEEWRDGAIRLAINQDAVAAVDKAVGDAAILPRSNGAWQVVWPLAFLLLLMGVPVAIILYTRRRAAR